MHTLFSQDIGKGGFLIGATISLMIIRQSAKQAKNH